MDHERQLSERPRCRFARLCMIDSFMGTSACQVTAGGPVLSFPFERGPDITRGDGGGGERLMLIDTRIIGRNGRRRIPTTKDRVVAEIDPGKRIPYARFARNELAVKELAAELEQTQT